MAASSFYLYYFFALIVFAADFTVLAAVFFTGFAVLFIVFFNLFVDFRSDVTPSDASLIIFFSFFC